MGDWEEMNDAIKNVKSSSKFQCLDAVGDWAEMDDAVGNVNSPIFKGSFLYKCLALKCHVMNKRPNQAWAVCQSHAVLYDMTRQR